MRVTDDNGWPTPFGVGLLVGISVSSLVIATVELKTLRQVSIRQLEAVTALEGTTASVTAAVGVLDNHTAKLMKWSFVIALIAATIGAVVAKLL